MTTIFTYPLSNARVLVADKLESNQTESERKLNGYETYPHTTTTKINSKGRYVFGLAGFSEDIKKIEELLISTINQRFNFKKFKEKLLKFYGSKVEELDTEIILIDSQKVLAYKIIIKDMESKLNDIKIDSIEDSYIGSGALKSRAKYQSSPLLESLKDIEIKKPNSKKLRSLFFRTVTAMEILAKSDTQFTGHPAVYGCNICIALKNKILNYEILPKKYICKEKSQSKWFHLEELEDA